MNILAQHLQNFVDYATVRGINKEKMLVLLTSELTDLQTTIPEAEFYNALNAVHQQLNDDLLGLKCGNFITLKLLGVIYQLSLQATTIEEAFHYLQSYMEATLPIVKVETVISEKEAKVQLSIDHENQLINRIILENCLAIISRELKMMAGQETNIRIGTPFYNKSYPEGWQIDECFSVFFELIILKASLKDRNQLHLDLLVPEYLKMIEQLKAGNSFVNKVRLTMLSMSDPKLPDIQSISDALYLTPRTLQRRLVQEEMTYREITEGLKKDICSFLIRHDQYSISSLTYILGYAEPASFIHSFKKWYGDSPQKVRRKLKESLNLG